MGRFPSGHAGDSLTAFWFAFTAMKDLPRGLGFLEYMKEAEIESKEKKGKTLAYWNKMYEQQKGE